MKKFAILVVSTMLVLAGCQNGEVPQNGGVVSAKENRNGVLQSLAGASNSAGATHLLRLEDGKTIFLKSEKVNLEDEKYKGKQVELSGNLLEKVEGKDVMEVLTIDLIEEEDENSLTSNEIPLWEDYDAPKMGIAFKYRDDYEIEEEENSLTIKKRVEEEDEEKSQDDINFVPKKDPAIFSFVLYQNESNLLEFLELPGDSMNGLGGGGFNKSKLGVNSVEALKRVDGDKVEYYLTLDKGILQIEFIAGEEENKNSDQNMFYDILASLKVYNGNTLSNLPKENLADENDMSIDLTGHDEGGMDEEVIEDKEKVEDEDDGEINSTEESAVPGYETFVSDGYKFSVLYPKSYYFGSEGGSYNFSSKPLEESSEVSIKLTLGGDLPEGKSIPSENNTEIVKIKDGNTVNYYVKGSGRVYKLSGASNEDTKMMIMAQSLKD